MVSVSMCRCDAVYRCMYMYRCYYLAQGYVTVKRWREAIALLDRVQQYGQMAVDSVTASNTGLSTVSQVIGSTVKVGQGQG
jgi:hypothetical protein